MRVVSLLPSSTEIVCALGCRHLLVGRSHECDHPSGVEELPACTAPKFDPDGTSYEIDQRVKAILQEAASVYRVDADLLDDLAPDWLVTQSQCEVCAVSLKDVEEAACRLVSSRPGILSLEPNRLEDLWSDIGRVAAALEVEERGRALVAERRQRLDRLAALTATVGERPTVACIEWFEPLMAAGNWIPELVEIGGGCNLLSTAGAHSPWLSWEDLEEAQPQFILLMPCGFDIPRSRKELPALTRQPAWARLRAVHEGRVFLTDGNQFFNRPGPRLVESAEIVAEILHPGEFEGSHERRGWERLEAGCRDETVAAEEGYEVRRRGRFLIVELLEPHRVLCTSAAGGGQREDLRYLVNHQSCEGRGHQDRFLRLKELGEDGYHRAVCADLGLDPEAVGLMGTAANMNCAAFASEKFGGVRVRAVVTAGVEGNAGRAGDPARWHEGVDGWCEVDPLAGTINVLLLIDWPLTAAALARAAITLTEAKSAALQELAVSSRSSEGLATGTGTDQYAIAAPLDDRAPKANPGHHARLGELIGRAVLRATRESLRWQNGLEPSHTRSIPYALCRFGLDETRLMEALRERLDEDAFALLEQNRRAVLHEPQAAAAAHAFAAVWDRVRYGTLPADQAAPVLRRQAAVLASCLAARPESWTTCWEQLAVDAGDPLPAVADAMALGWRLKWD